ncbi:hypothetical protein OG775_38350 [Streptomyces platensis]|uniref:hypothetical protein n=1 Tax=Streptomyces TaxID=1883 RepID=UPI001B3C6578|nr:MULTISPECIES: hypothetical protein [Streptomyces]MCX4640888.1 hypothetical protein [Streptomyces platensis]
MSGRTTAQGRAGRRTPEGGAARAGRQLRAGRAAVRPPDGDGAAGGGPANSSDTTTPGVPK